MPHPEGFAPGPRIHGLPTQCRTPRTPVSGWLTQCRYPASSLQALDLSTSDLSIQKPRPPGILDPWPAYPMSCARTPVSDLPPQCCAPTPTPRSTRPNAAATDRCLPNKCHAPSPISRVMSPLSRLSTSGAAVTARVRTRPWGIGPTIGQLLPGLAARAPQGAERALTSWWPGVSHQAWGPSAFYRSLSPTRWWLPKVADRFSAVVTINRRAPPIHSHHPGIGPSRLGCGVPIGARDCRHRTGVGGTPWLGRWPGMCGGGR